MKKASLQALQQKYEITAKIGSGGFGVVYIGRDIIFDKPVAIKAVDSKYLDNPHFVELFLKEAKNAAKLSHPNIVNIYDLVQDESGAYYIVMEFIEGSDLEKIIARAKEKKQTLPVNLAVYIVKEICKALDYAHNKRDPLTHQPMKLIHRDISPSNILISRQGRVKLIDFGIAQLKLAQQQKGEFVLAGKLPYVAPEFVTDSPIDRRVDIFSLGMLFYEMLTGDRLLEPASSEEAVQILRKYKPNLKKIQKSNIPEKLQKIIIKMIQKKPHDRYFAANGVYLDCNEYLMENAESVELEDELAEFLGKLIPEDEKLSFLEEKFELDESAENQATLSANDTHKSSEQELETKNETIKKVPEKVTASTLKKVEEAEQEIDKILSEIENEYAQQKRMEIIRTKRDEEEKLDAGTEKFTQSLKLADPKLVEEVPEVFEEEGEKTVIDIVRLAGKTSGAFFKKLAIAIIILLALGFFADVYFRITPLGKTIYSKFFSFEIQLETTPPGAKVYVDDKKLPGITPLKIPKIEPGVHQLTLSHPGFTPITRALFIPEKGNMQIAGGVSEKRGRTYHFSFKSVIELESEPPGAEIFINGVKFPEKTPTSIEWPAAQKFNLEMRIPEFGKIDGFSLDLSEDSAVYKGDANIWTFSNVGNIVKRYRVNGRLVKSIVLKIIPEDIQIFVDGEPYQSRFDDGNYRLALSKGSHQVMLKKDGFNDKLINLRVDEKAESALTIYMDRPVKIAAFEEGDPDKAIPAIVTRVIAGREYTFNRETPCILSIPYREAEIHLEADGYQPTKIIVPENADNVVANLEPNKNSLSISVNDALTGLPIKEAKIYYRTTPDSTASETLLGITDEDGKLIAKLRSGDYFLRAVKERYYDRKAQIALKDSAHVSFKLIIH